MVEARESGRLLLVDMEVLERERRMSAAIVCESAVCLHQNKGIATGSEMTSITTAVVDRD